ncbi:MAG: lactate utilization protein B [Chitinophagaceae bacterium]
MKSNTIDPYDIFLGKSKIKSFDKEHRRKLEFSIHQYDKFVSKGKSQFIDLEMARSCLYEKKQYAIAHLDELLLQFEENFIKKGGKVIWAENEKDAIAAVLKICKTYQTKTVVKSKSMVTEEIYLNHFLEKFGIESVETDLGEFIQQLDDETPYHIVTPAMHKSKEDVAKLFHEKLKVEKNLTPSELTQVARQLLRKKFQEAEVGITGVNFIIPDTGSIVVTENEGNVRMATAFPKVHIAIAGIERIIPSINDLPMFLSMLATHGTGQYLTAYNTIFSGPKQGEEENGPEAMYVILLDNGRVNLLEDKNIRQALYCIRCGACLNTCPIYKAIGGHAYATTYTGPIGSVITPHLKNMNQYKYMSYACSSCGACSEVCPVKIPLHDLLRKNRNIAVEEGLNTKTENFFWCIYRIGMSYRFLMNLFPVRIKNIFIKKYFYIWNMYKKPLHFPALSFNAIQRKKKKKTVREINN